MTDPVDFLLRAAMRLQRPEIERLAEGLIAGLDVLDGDTDLEDDDPPGGNVEDVGENADAEGVHWLVGDYGIDQRIARIAYHAHNVDNGIKIRR